MSPIRILPIWWALMLILIPKQSPYQKFFNMYGVGVFALFTVSIVITLKSSKLTLWKHRHLSVVRCVNLICRKVCGLVPSFEMGRLFSLMGIPTSDPKTE